MNPGAEKVTVAWPLLTVAETDVGAPGATAFTAKLWLTVGARACVLSPSWSASIEQVPTATKVRTFPASLHTVWVVELNVTASPEVAEADSTGDDPNDCAPGLAKVMV